MVPIATTLSGTSPETAFLLVQSDASSRMLKRLKPSRQDAVKDPDSVELQSCTLYRAGNALVTSQRARATAAARYSRDSVIVGFSAYRN